MDENQLQNNSAESGMEKNITRDTERDNTAQEQEGGTFHEASVKTAESSNLPPVRNVPPVATAYRTETDGKSYFDGTTLQLIGWRFLGSLVSLITLGLCTPWAFTMIYRWEANHTYIEGRKLRFDGSALQLFGKWIVWLLVAIGMITIFCVVEGALIAGTGAFSSFDNLYRTSIFTISALAVYFVFVIVVFLYGAWVEVALRKWKASHTFFAN